MIEQTDLTPFQAVMNLVRNQFTTDDLYRDFQRVMARDLESEPSIEKVIDRTHRVLAGTCAREWLKPECRPDPIAYVPTEATCPKEPFPSWLKTAAI